MRAVPQSPGRAARSTVCACLLMAAAADLRAQAGIQFQRFMYPPPPIPSQPSIPEAPADGPARILHAVKPQYPYAYARKGVRGTVLVELRIEADGSVSFANALSSPDPRLAVAAEAAVLQWIFRPAIRNGIPVASRARVPIVFRPPAGGVEEDPEAAADEARTRGVEALGRGDPAAALSAFEAALRLQPREAELLYDRGLAREALGRRAEALGDYAAAIRANPEDIRFHLARGQLEAADGDAPAALAEFGVAVGIAPEVAAGHSLRGRVFASLKRDDEALEELDAALALDPRDAEAARARASIEAARARLPAAGRKWLETRYLTFSHVWRTVDEAYYDPGFGGVDWDAVREKYRARLAAVSSMDALRMLLVTMLGELRRTHFAILPKEGVVFNPAERVRIGTAGVEVAGLGGEVVVCGVRAGSAGAAAGIRPGDLVLQADKVDLATAMGSLAKAGVPASRRTFYLVDFVQSRLEGPVGSAVLLRVSTGANGPPRKVQVTCRANDAVWSEPAGHVPSFPIRWEAKRGADGVAVLRFGAFALPVMKPVREFVRSLQPGDGLILDLRGNPGGLSPMASGIAGLLITSEISLGTFHSRDESEDLPAYPQDGAFGGPVAILIDGRSASTSEILAAGLKENGRARVFGERSAGAALPSLFATLPTGDLFQYAIADVTTPHSTVIEGTGVTPDETVPTTRADLAAGRDPVMEAARRWLASRRSAP
jgi:carboxyl-terminal processing protease